MSTRRPGRVTTFALAGIAHPRLCSAQVAGETESSATPA